MSEERWPWRDLVGEPHEEVLYEPGIVRGCKEEKQSVEKDVTVVMEKGEFVEGAEEEIETKGLFKEYEFGEVVQVRTRGPERDILELEPAILGELATGVVPDAEARKLAELQKVGRSIAMSALDDGEKDQLVMDWEQLKLSGGLPLSKCWIRTPRM